MSSAAAAPQAQADVLTVEEAAAFLRVNRNTLYEAINRGEGPPVCRVGRAVRIYRAALVGWMASQGHAAPQPKSRRGRR